MTLRQALPTPRALSSLVLAGVVAAPVATSLTWSGESRCQPDESGEDAPEVDVDDDVPDNGEGDAEADGVDARATDSAAGEASTGALALDAPPDDVPDPVDTKPKDAEYLLGLRYRGIIIPKFVLSPFVDGGKSVYVHGFGPELAIITEDVEYNLSAWASLYDMSPVAIKGASNEEEAWEIVESDLTAIYLSGDFLWTTTLTRGLDLTYGGSGGVGILFGELYRTQAYLRQGGSEGNADDYLPCERLASQNDPSYLYRYCDDANQHYPGYGEPGWLNGGSKPLVFPWISGQIGLRYRAHDKLVTRLDIGVGSSGFFFGVGADYAL